MYSFEAAANAAPEARVSARKDENVVTRLRVMAPP
jgi:hypothetical protein